MTRILPLAAATALILAASAASASPQIPTWANPYPAEPVATDGSPLPTHGAGSGFSANAVDQFLSGRSVYVGHGSRR